MDRVVIFDSLCSGPRSRTHFNRKKPCTFTVSTKRPFASKIDQIKGSLVFKLRREFLQLNHPLALEGVGPVVLRHLDHFGGTGGDQS